MVVLIAFEAAAVGFQNLMHPLRVGIDNGFQLADVLGGDGGVFTNVELAGDLVEIAPDAQ